MKNNDWGYNWAVHLGQLRSGGREGLKLAVSTEFIEIWLCWNYFKARAGLIKLMGGGLSSIYQTVGSL